jgi:CRP-like cAMP-binding protein
MTSSQLHPLLDLDPQLGQLLSPERLAEARLALHARVAVLPLGEWDTSPLIDGARAEHLGLLVLQGAISRDVLMGRAVSTELLGPGDVLRPWALEAPEPLLSREVRWYVLSESRVAILDRAIAARIGQWPEVGCVLADRLSWRAERLATTQAISQLTRVDRRVLAFFWHAAERWGRMTRDGIVVPLALSHRMLGQFVGARRPTVTTAVQLLAETGELTRREDGTWLLDGDRMMEPEGEASRVITMRRPFLPPREAGRAAAQR